MDNQQWRAAHVSYQLPPLLSTLGAYLRISTHARYLQSMSASNPAFSPAVILWASVSNVQNQYHSGQKFPALIQDEHNEHGWVSSLSSLQLSSSASVKTRQKTCTDAHQPLICVMSLWPMMWLPWPNQRAESECHPETECVNSWRDSILRGAK